MGIDNEKPEKKVSKTIDKTMKFSPTMLPNNFKIIYERIERQLWQILFDYYQQYSLF